MHALVNKRPFAYVYSVVVCFRLCVCELIFTKIVLQSLTEYLRHFQPNLKVVYLIP